MCHCQDRKCISWLSSTTISKMNHFGLNASMQGVLNHSFSPLKNRTKAPFVVPSGVDQRSKSLRVVSFLFEKISDRLWQLTDSRLRTTRFIWSLLNNNKTLTNFKQPLRSSSLCSAVRSNCLIKDGDEWERDRAVLTFMWVSIVWS